MLSKTLALSSTFAVAASAFLLPPSVSNEVEDPSKNFHVTIADPYSQVLKLDCPGCLFAKPNEGIGYTWVADVPNSLVLNFTVRHSYSEFLKLNDVQFYPSSLQVPEALLASQESHKSAVHDEEDFETVESPKLRLSYAFEFRPVLKAADSENELVPILLDILALDGQPINVDTVELNALKTPDGKLMVVSLKALHDGGKNEQGAPAEDKKCTTSLLLCKWRAIFAEKLKGMKNSIKSCSGGWKYPSKSSIDHSVRPQHESHHGHRKHHHGLKSSLHKITTTIVQVFVPVLIGIAAGMTASLLGLAVGQLIVLLWWKYGRSGKKGPYYKIEQDDESDEKITLVQHGQAVVIDAEPPKYEDTEVVPVAVEKVA
ncbi:MAG: hypothetical protein M1827_004541 [Pycnora praestabilis]|nr:MAG: hypothetical protein M1827_004541 [Pycnora praestabilis]